MKGVMSSSVHSPGDHVEESLPLPRVYFGNNDIHQSNKNKNLQILKMKIHKF